VLILALGLWKRFTKPMRHLWLEPLMLFQFFIIFNNRDAITSEAA
jgi:hypothetical protein